MKSTKLARQRPGTRVEQPPRSTSIDQAASAPDIPAEKPKKDCVNEIISRVPWKGQSSSESHLRSKENDENPEEPIRLEQFSEKGDQSARRTTEDMRQQTLSPPPDVTRICTKTACQHPGLEPQNVPWKQERSRKCSGATSSASKKSLSSSTSIFDGDESLARKIREIHNDSRKSARIIRDSRARLLEIQKKTTITEADVKELGERNELLLREMDRFDKLTRNIQKLVGNEVPHAKKPIEAPQKCVEYVPGSIYEPPLYHEMKMNHPTVLLAGLRDPGGPGVVVCNPPTRCKSEIDLTRKLSESYDMQEKLVADNADLEVKRYILYKELMTKDQNLETCRAQIKRLQGELKLMNKENGLLHEKLNKNNPEGDATPIDQDHQYQHDTCTQDRKIIDSAEADELINKLENYKTSTVELCNDSYRGLCKLDIKS